MHAWNYILAVAAVAWGMWNFLRYRRDDPGEAWLGWIAVTAGGAKLWLALGQPLYAAPAAPYDDRLFLQLATSLLEGHWLGPYNQLTLAKGPFYPIFMASCSLLRIPLITAQNLVYIIASCIFVRALRPLRLSDWLRAILLLAMLLCPILTDTGAFVRAWRQSLWPSLVLLSFAGTLGLSLRGGTPPWRRTVWALVAGSAIGAMWLTREEAVWTLPMLLLPLVVAGWRDRRRPDRRARILGLILPLAVAALPVAAIAGQNFRVYGFWGIVEFRDDAFVSAYSALCRVRPQDPERRIPVTRLARERIYQVSPAFASLRHEIEEGIGAAFMRVTRDYTGIPEAEHEIGGGWMMWALRDAVAFTGQAKSAPQAQAFYRRLADEVNAACDQGRLPASSLRNSMRPRWRREYLPKVWIAAKTSYLLIVDYTFDAEPLPSLGSQGDITWVERITREQAAPPDPSRAAGLRSPLRLGILRATLTGYHVVMRWLLPITAVLWVAILGRTLFRLELRPLVVVSTSLALGIIGNLAVVAMVDATSWPSVTLGYLGASVPLAIGFVASVLAELVAMFGRVGGAPSQSTQGVRSCAG